MPRPLRQLDPSAGPIQAFAAELRKLHEKSGSPKFLQMARRTGKSRTALTEAAGGDHLPTWETLTAFVTACGADPNEWRARWETARDEVRRSASATQVDDSVAEGEDGPREVEAERPLHQRLRRMAPLVIVAILSAAMASGATMVVLGDDSPEAAEPTSSRAPTQQAVIAVQNKIAVGANELIEDSTPAFLSTEPRPYCASHKCKVEGTDLASDAILVAVCYVNGTEMFNYNLDSSESKNNPHRSRSTLWYKAVFPDGKAGYISEVYIAAEHRGGVGLPECSSPVSQ